MPTLMQTRWLVTIELCDIPNPETKLVQIDSKDPASKAYIKSCIKDAMDKTWQKHRASTTKPYCIDSILQTINITRDYELACHVVQADFAVSDIE